MGHIVQFDSRTRGIQSIFTTKSTTTTTNHNCIGPWMLGILVKVTYHCTHCSLPLSPAPGRQVSIKLKFSQSTYLLLLLLYYCFHLPLFNTLVFFLTEKTFQRQSRLLLLPLDSLWAYPEMEPRRLAA